MLHVVVYRFVSLCHAWSGPVVVPYFLQIYKHKTRSLPYGTLVAVEQLRKFIESFLQVSVNNINLFTRFHHFTYYTSETYWSVVGRFMFISFFMQRYYISQFPIIG